MPWNGPSFVKHNKSLRGSPEKASHAATIADRVLEKSGDEGMAIAVANKWAKKHKRAMGGPAPTVPTYQTAPVNVNSAGFVPTPQPGDFNLDLNTGATTSGTRSAIQTLAQRGLPIQGASGGGGGGGGGSAAPASNGGGGASGDPNVQYSPAWWAAGKGPSQLTYGTPDWWGAVQAMGQTNQPAGANANGDFGGGGGFGSAGGEGGGGMADGGAHLAEGGVGASMTNWQTRRAASGETSGGFSGGLISGPTGGRADKVSMNLPSHSHVIPALAVAGMGGGNTEAGAAHLNNVFNTGPFGSAMPKVPRGSGPRSLGMSGKPPRLARGGPAEGHHETYVSHGEYVVSPEEVLRIGNGDYNAGHDWLDKFIKHIHKEVGRQATHAPPPVKER